MREIKEGACVGKGRGGKISIYVSVEFVMPVTQHTSSNRDVEGIVGHTVQALNFTLYSGKYFNY